MDKIIWVDEKEQQEELKARIKNWKDGQSKDGYVLAGEGTFTYRGIKYIIKVLRYYNHTDKFTPIGSRRISDKHVVVEHPEETDFIAKIVDEIEPYSDFLYHDTLHDINDNQTVEEQIEISHKWAKEDIDRLFDGSYKIKIEEKIKNLRNLLKKLDDLHD
jgi:hypothetical protein